MYSWSKRSIGKLKDYHKTKILFVIMVLAMTVMLFYRLSAVEMTSNSHKLTRENNKDIELDKVRKVNMDNNNDNGMMLTKDSLRLLETDYNKQIVSNLKKEFSVNKKNHFDSVNNIKEDIKDYKYYRNIVPLFKGHRIVHLDLKGAPPKISYYQEIFPIISSLGGTGLLVEYEDMFPYRYSDLTARNAYSKGDISKLIDLATENNLEVIPLVQTFGHLEFMLKLKKYKHLREVSNYPQVVCPSNNSTFPLLKDLIDDIVELHPKSNYIHIGCDEVYYIGMCSRCIQKMLKKNWTKKDLFLHHVIQIARYIKEKYPHLTVLSWDDEFRKLTLNELVEEEIGKLIEPVVWKYTQDVESDLPFNLWEKYSKVFPSVWIASAFKGATGSDKYTTLIYYHYENHRAWMRLVKEYSNRIVFKGIFLTGWQRYDHFSILCELLPVGLPSLAVNLAYISNTDIDQSEPPDNAISILKCDSADGLMLNSIITHCSFPGSKIYDTALRLYNLNDEVEKMTDNSAFRGWFSEYNEQMMFSSRSLVEQATSDLDQFIIELDYIETDMRSAMSEVYDSTTVTEWISTYIKPLKSRLQKYSNAKEKLLSKDDWPRRPLTPILERLPRE